MECVVGGFGDGLDMVLEGGKMPVRKRTRAHAREHTPERLWMRQLQNKFGGSTHFSVYLHSN